MISGEIQFWIVQTKIVLYVSCHHLAILTNFTFKTDNVLF